MTPDLRSVADAASILQLREFDLFRAAWQNWFGEAPDDKVVERHFVDDYMFNQRIPHWVRHFARRVIADAQYGEVDPRRFGIANYPRQEPLPDLGGGFLAMVFSVAVVLSLLLTA